MNQERLQELTVDYKPVLPGGAITQLQNWIWGKRQELSLDIIYANQVTDSLIMVIVRLDVAITELLIFKLYLEFGRWQVSLEEKIEVDDLV